MIISLVQFFDILKHIIYTYFHHRTFGTVRCHLFQFPTRDVLRCVFRFRSPL